MADVPVHKPAQTAEDEMADDHGTNDETSDFSDDHPEGHGGQGRSGCESDQNRHSHGCGNVFKYQQPQNEFRFRIGHAFGGFQDFGGNGGGRGIHHAAHEKGCDPVQAETQTDPHGQNQIEKQVQGAGRRDFFGDTGQAAYWKFHAQHEEQQNDSHLSGQIQQVAVGKVAAQSDAQQDIQYHPGNPNFHTDEPHDKQQDENDSGNEQNREINVPHHVIPWSVLPVASPSNRRI